MNGNFNKLKQTIDWYE